MGGEERASRGETATRTISKSALGVRNVKHYGARQMEGMGYGPPRTTGPIAAILVSLGEHLLLDVAELEVLRVRPLWCHANDDDLKVGPIRIWMRRMMRLAG